MLLFIDGRQGCLDISSAKNNSQACGFSVVLYYDVLGCETVSTRSFDACALR